MTDKRFKKETSAALTPLHKMKLSDSNVVLHSVLAFVKSFRTLNHLSKINKAFFEDLVKKGRDVWTDLAVEVLAYPLKQFIPEEIKISLIAEWEDNAPKHKPFFDYLRSLVCPWTTVPDFLDVGNELKKFATKRFLFVVEEGQRLCLQRRETNYPYQSTFPSSAVENFSELITSYAQSQVFNLKERYFREEFRDKFPAGFDEFRLTNTSSLTASIEKFPIHGGVWAFVMVFKNHQGCMEGKRGVYFVSCADQRILTYIEMDISSIPEQNFVQSRPGQLWVLTEKQLLHYHQKMSQMRCRDDPSLRVMVPSTQLSTTSQRMGEAFYLASIGDHQGALAVVRKTLGTDVNARAEFNGRTILHYAAKNGQTASVEKIMEEGGYAWMRDRHSESPMYLACLNLHEGCVEKLIVGVYNGGRDSSEVTLCWNALTGEKPLLTGQPTGPDMTQGEQEARFRHWSNVSIPRIVAAFLNMMDQSGMKETLVKFFVRKGWESPWILSSPEAMRLIFRFGERYDLFNTFMNGGTFRNFFGEFNNTFQADLALDTIEMMIKEFSMDINFKKGLTQDPPFVWAVRTGSYNAVKTMTEKFKADTKIVSVDGHMMLQLAMRRNSYVIRDRYADQIVEYLSGFARR